MHKSRKICSQIVFSLEKFHQYTFWHHVKIQSDHKPLESILKKFLGCAPRRLQGVMMRLQKYNIELRYERGKDLHLANTLSRAYKFAKYRPSRGSWIREHQRSCLSSYIQFNTSRDPASNRRWWRGLQSNTSTDSALLQQEGWTSYTRQSCISQTVNRRTTWHVAQVKCFHLSVESCLRRACKSIFWAGMSAKVKELITTCETCRKNEVSNQKESMMPLKVPTRPWEQVSRPVWAEQERLIGDGWLLQ